MNNKSLVKLSNTVGIISIILLIYWVFIFISISVFGLKVFKENLTETFYLSVLGIFALMFAALMLNIMFNLTRIAEKHNQDSVQIKTTSKKFGLIFGVSFPIIFALLFGGDYLSSKKKEEMLIKSAKSIVEKDVDKSNELVNYTFDEKWIIRATDILEIYSKTDRHFNYITLIVPDTLDKSPLFLGFRNYYGDLNDTIAPIKKNFIQETTEEEREYLDKVFHKDFDQVRFSANDGRYELFYPYFKNGKKIVLYFSEFQQYGKIGS